MSYSNSVDLDQTPRLAASDLGLHFLSHFLLDARHKKVNAWRPLHRTFAVPVLTRNLIPDQRPHNAGSGSI